MTAQIDKTLREAVDAGTMPGVVAMAATADGPLYEGAFGVRRLGASAPMTRDTVFRIASMTKALTCVAAMQLVEQGKLSLDGPLPAIDPGLSQPQVLTGFDAAGRPQLRPATRPITLKHLMTHTAGFCYTQWNKGLLRYVSESGMPLMATGKFAAMRQPLMFDPGERWEYGINIDWIGRLVEEASGQKLDAYFAEHVTGPLGMKDTGFEVSDEQRARQAAVHQRHPDGRLEAQPFEQPVAREFLAGGGGLYSTAGDYLKFLQALLQGGQGILKPETVALMGENHIGSLPAGVLKTANPPLTNDVDFFPGQRVRWGLAYMLTLDPGPNGRSPGSVTWAGIFNTYYWLDPVKRLAGVIMTQVLPFADQPTLDAYGAFERGVYAEMGKD
ncbi:MAG TPA: serine hydrolase domain-containing protein [Stellaceae bacterium]|jgi:methyl acetate hydrolase|nr:serine hydrolase domain-containing protein [Stellaceae bacterium]